MLRTCSNCGKSVELKTLTAGLCPRCLAHNSRKLLRAVTGSWSPGRDQTAHVRMRRAVRKRAGGCCEHVEDGVRCTTRTGLSLHHDRPGYEPEDGRLLCGEHHPHWTKSRGSWR
jgi:hypothetical protein